MSEHARRLRSLVRAADFQQKVNEITLLRATHIYCARSRRTINLPLATGQVCYAARGIHKRRVFAGELLVDNYVRRHLRSRLQRILLRRHT